MVKWSRTELEPQNAVEPCLAEAPAADAVARGFAEAKAKTYTELFASTPMGAR